MPAADRTLYIAAVPYESGVIRYRYSRYLSDDETHWIRHGLFISYHENGNIASEVHYQHGAEHGPCRDYHPNGILAAEGEYLEGQEHGRWRFWSPDGREERSSTYEHGVEVDA